MGPRESRGIVGLVFLLKIVKFSSEKVEVHQFSFPPRFQKKSNETRKSHGALELIR